MFSGQQIFQHGATANEDIRENGAVLENLISYQVDEFVLKERILKRATHKAKAMLASARINIGQEFQVEFSHHYGIENFFEVGTILITVVNREYAKKLIVQLPNQTHPAHYHKLKEETFIVLSGELTLTIENDAKVMMPGDKVTVLPGTWHSFSSDQGCIFEEISSAAIPGDSVYSDPKIGENLHRKTPTDNWGRFQIAQRITNSGA